MGEQPTKKPTKRRRLRANDLVEIRIVARVGGEGEGPLGVTCVAHDALGNELRFLMKRAWLRELRNDRSYVRID